MSFQDSRNALLAAHEDGIIDDEEFVLLYEQNTSKNPCCPYEEYSDLLLEDIDPAECKAEFRFEKNDLPLLAEALHIPGQFICEQRSVCTGMEGLCMALKRLVYPCRYSDMIPRFGKPVPVLSMITNRTIDYIYEQHSHRITEWNQLLLEPPKLQMYAEATRNKGAALDNCFGFIDGTVRPICRPGENQRVVYNGHKRVHALKFQSVTFPTGMIAHMYGPVGKVLDVLHEFLITKFIIWISLNILGCDRGQETWCWNAGRLWITQSAPGVCLFTNWLAHVFVWGPSVPSASTPTGTI